MHERNYTPWKGKLLAMAVAVGQLFGLIRFVWTLYVRSHGYGRCIVQCEVNSLAATECVLYENLHVVFIAGLVF